MPVSKQQLLAIMPRIPQDKVDTYLVALNQAMREGEINTKLRTAMFLAQIAHESCQLKYMRELWGPTTQQDKYERDYAHPWPPTPQDRTNKLAFILGNSEGGDGYAFRGWGPIQNTGRANTTKASKDIFGDNRLIDKPELLNDPLTGFRGAVWYWTSRNLNKLADAGDVKGCTLAINGGYNGLQQRQAFYNLCMRTL